MGSSSSVPAGDVMCAVVRGKAGLEFSEQVAKPTGTLESDQVLVKVAAAAINPVDYKVSKWLLGPIAGLDVAGVVEEVSENSTSGLKVGDRVYGTARGSLAQWVTAKSKALGKIPQELSFAQAAAMPTAYITSLQGLRNQGGIKPGARVLIIGSSGGCGSAALQLARELQASLIVGVCSGKNAEFCRQLGAHEILDYQQDGFFDKPHFSTSEDEKFDIVYDAATNSGAGEDYKAWSLKRLKQDGQYVAINAGIGMWLRKFTIGQKKNQHLFLTNMNTADLDTLSDFVQKTETLRPEIMKELPFSAAGVEEGFQLLKSRRTKGKLVFNIGQHGGTEDQQQEQGLVRE